MPFSRDTVVSCSCSDCWEDSRLYFGRALLRLLVDAQTPSVAAVLGVGSLAGKGKQSFLLQRQSSCYTKSSRSWGHSWEVIEDSDKSYCKGSSSDADAVVLRGRAVTIRRISGY